MCLNFSNGIHALFYSLNMQCRINASTAGLLYDEHRSCLLEICADGVQAFKHRNHGMVPVAVRSYDIPFSHRSLKVGFAIHI